MRPDVTPISECVLPIFVLSNVSDSLRVLDVIAEAIRRRAKQSLAKQMMNRSKNEDELAKLRDELKDDYERFMVCHLSKECTPLISRCRSLLRFARRMHFRPFSRPWTLVGSVHPLQLHLIHDLRRRYPQAAHAYTFRSLRLPHVSIGMSPRHSTGNHCATAYLGRRAHSGHVYVMALWSSWDRQVRYR
jgi:hypothetical protein